MIVGDLRQLRRQKISTDSVKLCMVEVSTTTPAHTARYVCTSVFMPSIRSWWRRGVMLMRASTPPTVSCCAAKDGLKKRASPHIS